MVCWIKLKTIPIAGELNNNLVLFTVLWSSLFPGNRIEGNCFLGPEVDNDTNCEIWK